MGEGGAHVRSATTAADCVPAGAGVAAHPAINAADASASNSRASTFSLVYESGDTRRAIADAADDGDVRSVSMTKSVTGVGSA